MCFWCGLGWDGPITFMCLRYPAITHVTLQHALALSNRQRVQCNQEPPAAAQHGRSVAALTLSYVVPCQCVSSPRIAIRIAGEWQHHYALLHAHTLHCIKLHYITLRYITSHHTTLHIITLHYINMQYITSHHIAWRYCCITLYTLNLMGHASLSTYKHGHMCKNVKWATEPARTKQKVAVHTSNT